MDIRIEPFDERYREGVGALIVTIQQREFAIPITYDQQPDLRDIAGFYRHKAGDFWLALAGERVVGSIALLDIGDRLGALRKMFVAADCRGAGAGVAGRLLSELLRHARAHRLRAIYLGTTDKFLAAHRFYEKHGFELVERDRAALIPGGAIVVVALLRAIGRAVAERDTVVLLKRGLHMGPLNEFISAAEYIASFGNPNILLCPRGTSPALDGYRNHPDESITPLLKEKTWAPVVVDPSHSVGKASYVPAAALAAVAYGADGLCIEAHVSPNHGIGDDPKQALTPDVLATTIKQAKQLWALRRSEAKN